MEKIEKNEVLIEFLRKMIPDYQILGEYKTSNSRVKQITVQEHTGEKIIFSSDIDPLFNYMQIVIFGNSIKEQKELANKIGSLIGRHEKIKIGKEHWQIIFKQFSNPELLEYQDIKRVGYTLTLKCIINKFYMEVENDK